MKRAIVTGGTRGIGLAVCRLLSENGYAVTATYSASEQDAVQARAELPAVEFVRVDVRDEGAVETLLSRFSALDVLVNNAGVALFAQVQDTASEEYARVMDVNMRGTFLFCKHAVKRMLERGGAIVNISSVWGEVGASCESVYAASKGAVIAFTKSLAKELAPANITVNCVSPGVIATSMNARLSEAELEEVRGEIPLGRLGTPEEVAAAVLYLVSARYVTGEVLSVNGGFAI